MYHNMKETDKKIDFVRQCLSIRIISNIDDTLDMTVTQRYTGKTDLVVELKQLLVVKLNKDIFLNLEGGRESERGKERAKGGQRGCQTSYPRNNKNKFREAQLRIKKLIRANA